MARKQTHTTLEAFSIAFFVVLVIGFLVLDEQSIENLTRWSAALSCGGLAFITWATIVIGDPFTRQYARRTTPKEQWTSELFLSSTMSIALGRAVAFLGATEVSVIGARSGLNFFSIHSLAIGCMILAIIWHKRILNETIEKAKVLSRY